MMFIDCIWILLLGLYLDQVLPKEFGRRRHPCFMFTSEFWGCCKKKKDTAEDGPDPFQYSMEAGGIGQVVPIPGDKEQNSLVSERIPLAGAMDDSSRGKPIDPIL